MSRGSMVGLAAGALGSIALTIYAGLRVGAPAVLLGLFAVWVSIPFDLLAVALAVSTRWPAAIGGSASSRVVWVIAVASIIVYGVAALGTTRPPTPVFVLVAPAMCTVLALTLAVTAWRSRRSAASARTRPSSPRSL